ncbi:MAG: hypothetical protein WAN36_09780 [Calditrichia bacterium]
MNFRVFTYLIILSTTLSLSADSFFSSAEQGIGLRQYHTTTRGMGMGGTGLGMQDSVSLNAYNIAAMRHIPNSRITVLMNYTINQTDFGFQEVTTRTGYFSGLHLAIPLQRDKWVLAASLAPYTLVNFSYNQQHTGSLGTYEENTYFKGNLSRAHLSLVWSPLPQLGISAGMQYYFGTIKDRHWLIFNSQQLYNSSYELEYQFHGPGAGFSLEYQPLKALSLGGFVDLKPRLNFFKVSRSPIDFSEEEIQTKSSLPVFWGVGTSIQPSRRWRINADMAYQQWSGGFNIQTINLDRLEDWYHAGIGIERTHLPQRSRVFLDKIDIRAGASLSNIGYKFNNNAVMEYSGHVGLGIPFYQEKARFDIAFIAGIRGDRSQTVAQEKFFRFSFSISAGELWFQNLR